jgi:hypothetical protein
MHPEHNQHHRREKAEEMRNYYSVLLVITVSLPTLLLVNVPVSGNAPAQPQQLSQQDSTSRILINMDGNLSLSPEQNKIYWNPHSVGLTDASNWKITFINETEMHLQTTASECGHIAAGAWWTTAFKSRQKFPLYTSKPVQIVTSFRINILNAECSSGNEWLRIALACATQRIDGSVIYTEMDLWDSPTALANPSGNIRLGGNTVYKGADVVEYKIDQTPENEWRSYTLELTDDINKAWQLKPGDLLESVYFVVEAAGAVTVTLKADNLMIAQFG